MTMKIGIVNNGLGNVASVLSAFRFYDYRVSLVNSPQELKNTDLIVLAGVGNFKAAVSNLKKKGFWSKLKSEVIDKKKPVFGICLGMQLFAEKSYEGGITQGFGWIKGKVIKIDNSLARVPHIGWNEIRAYGYGNKIFHRIKYNHFYFMHSYHFVPDDPKVIIAQSDYDKLNFVSAVKYKNIIGVQFHPEKSQTDGLRLIKNIVNSFS